MSRKDYIAFANLLRGCRHTYDPDTVIAVADEIADLFARDNPSFDRARFLALFNAED